MFRSFYHRELMRSNTLPTDYWRKLNVILEKAALKDHRKWMFKQGLLDFDIVPKCTADTHYISQYTEDDFTRDSELEEEYQKYIYQERERGYLIPEKDWKRRSRYLSDALSKDSFEDFRRRIYEIDTDLPAQESNIRKNMKAIGRILRCSEVSALGCTEADCDAGQNETYEDKKEDEPVIWEDDSASVDEEEVDSDRCEDDATSESMIEDEPLIQIDDSTSEDEDEDDSDSCEDDATSESMNEDDGDEDDTPFQDENEDDSDNDEDDISEDINKRYSDMTEDVSSERDKRLKKLIEVFARASPRTRMAYKEFLEYWHSCITFNSLIRYLDSCITFNRLMRYLESLTDSSEV